MSVSSNSARMALAATIAACLLGSTSVVGEMSDIAKCAAPGSFPTSATRAFAARAA